MKSCFIKERLQRAAAAVKARRSPWEKSVCRNQILCDPRFKAYLHGRDCRSTAAHRDSIENMPKLGMKGRARLACHLSSDLLRASREHAATLHA